MQELNIPGDGGVRLAVRAHDPPGASAPGLLLHHGLASSQRIWDLMLPRLVNRFRVVTYDARGHGLSAKPSSGYGFERVVADARAVVRATNLRRPIVAGHSWGAMVALHLAANHPGSVSRAVLVDGGVGSLHDSMDWPAAKERLAPPHLAGMHVDELRTMIRGFLGGAVDVTPAIEEIVLSVMHVGRDGRIRPRLSRANHLRILRTIWLDDPSTAHRRLSVPTLAVLSHGIGDSEWDARKRRATRALARTDAPVRVSWIRGIHDIPLQHPDALAERMIRFDEQAVP